MAETSVSDCKSLQWLGYSKPCVLYRKQAGVLDLSKICGHLNDQRLGRHFPNSNLLEQ